MPEGARIIPIRNALLFARHEYLQRVPTLSFIFSTLVLPAIFVAIIWLPTVAARRISGLSTAPARRWKIAIAGPDTALNADVARALDDKYPGEFQIADHLAAAPSSKSLAAQVRSGQIDGYVTISDGARMPVTAEFTRPDSILGDGPATELKYAVWLAATEGWMTRHGLPETSAARIFNIVDFKTVTVKGAPSRHKESRLAAVVVLMMVMFFSLLTYGVMVMRAVLEEKNSRVAEVLMCSTTAGELMAGKVLGIGALGVTQVTAWAILGALFASQIPGAFSTIVAMGFGIGTLVWFVIFYVLGYLVYSAMYAAVGAAFNSSDEAQQWNFIIMLPLIATAALLNVAIARPSSLLIVAGSIFPLTSPVLMYARMAIGHPPIWQVALSVAVLAATAYLAIAVSARIYRVGILMYGKRPTVQEVIRWLHYA